jgi:hypothetical protein
MATDINDTAEPQFLGGDDARMWSCCHPVRRGAAIPRIHAWRKCRSGTGRSNDHDGGGSSVGCVAVAFGSVVCAVRVQNPRGGRLAD